MDIVTWNVNSIRARLDRVVTWLAANTPEVLCLQELKAEDEKFPLDPFTELGYEVATHGQKTYNGVAILSRCGLDDVERGFGDDVDDPQARLMAATCAGIRVVTAYVPNGQSVTSDKFVYKMAWLERLERWLEPRVAGHQDFLLCGDFNVAPDPIDVHDPEGFEGHVLFTTEERAALARVVDLGLTDLLRAQHPDQQIFTWWDYRQLGFPKNRGLRIDHILVSDSLEKKATGCRVDREARKGKQPSDHAPVIGSFDA